GEAPITETDLTVDGLSGKVIRSEDRWTVVQAERAGEARPAPRTGRGGIGLQVRRGAGRHRQGGEGPGRRPGDRGSRHLRADRTLRLPGGGPSYGGLMAEDRSISGATADIVADFGNRKVVTNFLDPSDGSTVMELHLDPEVAREYAFNLTRAALAL